MLNKHKHKHKNKSIAPPPEEEAHAQENRERSDDAAPQTDAPLPSPTLSETEKADLIAKGIPATYIDSRITRAAEYACSTRKSVCEVFRDWWHEDRLHPPWKGYRSKQTAPVQTLPAVGEVGRSFDADDFFAAALNRSFRELGVSLAELPLTNSREDPLPLPAP